MTAPSAYVICTTPRSGSTLLCRMLSATGIAGQPDSHFHAPSVERWLEAFGLAEKHFSTDREAVTAAVKAARVLGTGKTDVFGLRLQRGSFDYFVRKLALLHPEVKGTAEKIEAAFGPTLFIHLFRKDKLAQAISRVIAEQTGLWHRHSDGTDLERRAPLEDLRFDREAIARNIEELRELDAAWERWFAAEGIHPLQIEYETLAHDPRGVLADVLDALSLDRSAAEDVPIPTAKLASDTNTDWAARYRHRDQA